MFRVKLIDFYEFLFLIVGFIFMPFIVECLKVDNILLSIVIWFIGLVCDFYTTYEFYLEDPCAFSIRERNPLIKWFVKKFSILRGLVFQGILEFVLLAPVVVNVVSLILYYSSLSLVYYCFPFLKIRPEVLSVEEIIVNGFIVTGYIHGVSALLNEITKIFSRKK